MEEIWKEIKGFEGLYQISNYGNVKSESRLVNFRNNNKRMKKEIILKPTINNNGYCEVILYKDNKYKHYRVHRLVADAFIDNPNKYPIINHIDKDKTNNRTDNLEWCTYKYNNNYKKEFKPFYKGVKVAQYDLNMNYIKTYNSMYQIEKEYNVSRSAIRFCCLGKNKTCRGYIWRYVDE